jgi:hypothetical protein
MLDCGAWCKKIIVCRPKQIEDVYIEQPGIKKAQPCLNFVLAKKYLTWFDKETKHFSLLLTH